MAGDALQFSDGFSRKDMHNFSNLWIYPNIHQLL